MLKEKLEYLNKIDKKQVIALIPARGGSKGIPKKNIQMIGEYPLISYSIVVGTLSNYIDRIIVSTDSEEIAQIARDFGAEVPFIRPTKYATDSAGDIEFVEHAIRYLYENEGIIPEYLVHLRPTTPFRKIDIIDQAISKFMKQRDCSSLRSAHKAAESPYKWFVKSDIGYFKSIREDIDNDKANNARQEFPDVYIPDGYVDILRSSYVIQNNKLHGKKMMAFESPNCVEIDTFDDMEYARYQVVHKELELYDYLKQNF